MASAFVLSRTRTVAVAVVVALVAVVAWQLTAARPLNTSGAAVGTVHITMTVKGHKQGNFKGDIITGKDASNLINVAAYQYSVESPRDLATGQASGKRQHKPVMITHELGNSSPQFFAAVVTNETLDKVTINFNKVGANGKEVNFYTVTLTNASISEFNQRSSGSTVVEDISFTFQKIEQTNNITKESVSDDWESAA